MFPSVHGSQRPLQRSSKRSTKFKLRNKKENQMIGNIFVCFVVVVMAYAIYSALRHKREIEFNLREIERFEPYRFMIPKNKPDGTVLSEAEHEALVAQAVTYEKQAAEDFKRWLHGPIVMTKSDMLYKLTNDVAALRSLHEKKEETP